MLDYVALIPPPPQKKTDLGTTPSVEQSVDPSDQSEDNENLSLSASGGKKENSHRLGASESAQSGSADKDVHKSDIRARKGFLLDPLTPRLVESRSLLKDHTSSSASLPHDSQPKIKPLELSPFSTTPTTTSATTKMKPHHKAAGAKDADDFDVSTGTETFTPIRPHR